MASTFELVPKNVPQVRTKYRTIVTPIPVPQSLPIIESLRQYEPQSLSGQPLVVWDRAEDFSVFDAWGNRWLDFSSGVLVANAGHCNPAVQAAIINQTKHGLLHNYCFPSQVRAELVKALAGVAPSGLQKIFLLTTGAETTECAIKLARTHGQKVGGQRKIAIVSFTNAFHGRTMGSQMAGGIPALKQWIVNLDPAMVNVPFPDGFRCSNVSFDLFLDTLKQHKLTGENIAGVICETYQGGGASFAPPVYMQQLRKWCDENKVVLAFDEVQAGFGRTGTWWGFEHYGITPDIICCGKGISGGLPLSAVIGRAELMDLFPTGSMTSTHTGNPIAAASAIANIRELQARNAHGNAKSMGNLLHGELNRIAGRFSQNIAAVHGKGLVAGVHVVKPGSTEPDGEAAFEIIRKCIEKGLLLFAPVGFGGATVKISPPLIINREALLEGIAVLEEAFAETLA